MSNTPTERNDADPPPHTEPTEPVQPPLSDAPTMHGASPSDDQDSIDSPDTANEPPSRNIFLSDDEEPTQLDGTPSAEEAPTITHKSTLTDIPGDLVDHPRYRLVELLGQGGMGAVYKAEHRLMERVVALKIIRKDLVKGEDSLERFQREIRTAAKLNHPNIVAAYDAERAGETHFLVMEFVEGESLDRLLARRGPLPIPETCHYICQAANGLQHAYDQGMVHRDIKPHNLMRTPTGNIKILDFGLALFASETETVNALTELGSMMGTPDYMAPEQARDAHGADIRADIYSLGHTMYHLLTGQVPFPKGASLQKVMAHIEQQPTPLVEFRDDVPDLLVRVFERMTAKDPNDRFQTPASVIRTLAPIAQGKPAARKPARNPKKTQLVRQISGSTPSPQSSVSSETAPMSSSPTPVTTPPQSSPGYASGSSHPGGTGYGAVSPAKPSHSLPFLLGMVSLVLGGGALLFSWVPCLGIITVPFSGLGVLLGTIATIMSWEKKGRELKIAIAGVFVGLVAMIGAALVTWGLSTSTDFSSPNNSVPFDSSDFE